MTLPANGTLTMTQIANEADLNVSVPVNLGNRSIRNVARSFAADTRIAYTDLQGKSKFTFTNGSFGDGAVTPISSVVSEVPGWLIYLDQVKMNGLSNVAGFPTPIDATPPSDNSPAYPQPGYANYKYDVTYETDLPAGESAPTKSLRLVSLGITSSFGVVHGPYAVSKLPVSLEEGDEVSFWWKAEGGSDDYDIFAYLVKTTTGSTIKLIDQTGESSSATTPWAKVTHVITNTEASANWQIADYKFVFVSGSYDFSGGQWTGASLYITQIKVKKWFEGL
jgi:hypothetical protein